MAVPVLDWLSHPEEVRSVVHTSPSLSSKISAKQTEKGVGYQGRKSSGGNNPGSPARTCAQTAEAQQVQKAFRACFSTSAPDLFRQLPRSPTRACLVTA